MKKTIIASIISAGLVLALPLTVAAVKIDAVGCDGVDSVICGSGRGDNVDTVVSSVVNILMWIVGIVSVVMIVVGGMKYTMSNGDANKVQSAKNTILYSVVGVVVAVTAYVIVNFVVTEVT